jgi:hypothetical protein
MLTINLVDSSKYNWRKKLIRNKPLPVPAVAVSKPWAMSWELIFSQSSSFIAQNIVWIKTIILEIPLPVPAVAMNKPRAMSSELICSQSSSLIAQKSHEKLKFYKEKTTAGTSNGCKQALGHELWTHMFTMKLIDISKYSWKNLIQQWKYHCRYWQCLWASLGPWTMSSHAHNQAHW